MASNISRKKTGPFTVTRNLTTGSINVSTSTGHKAHRITQSVRTGQRPKITETFNRGGMYKRTSRIIGTSRRSRRKSAPSFLWKGLCSLGYNVLQNLESYEPPPPPPKGETPKEETPKKYSKIVDFAVISLGCMFLAMAFPKISFVLWVWLIWSFVIKD
jgi:hypothetical protein